MNENHFILNNCISARNLNRTRSADANQMITNHDNNVSTS